MIFGFRPASWRNKKSSGKTVSDYRMEAFLKFGREQLMKLRAKGISIPVALL